MRPNFVFIMADDLGYADLGCYGAREDCSPVLDRLAAEGLRFSNGYSNSPVCSPTRFGLMSGRYHYRLRGGNDEPIATRTRGNPVLGMPPSHPSFVSLLRDAGYRTALSGKWHLGFPPHFGPLKSGYEEFFGPLAGGVDYFSHLDSAGVHDLYEGEQESSRTGYLTDLITDAAVDFIGRQKKGAAPFLLSVHYTAPHWPWETREDAAESERIGTGISHTDGGSVATYRTMIRQMDEGIGRIMDALKATGADADTLVVFTSDNGGERFSDTWPLVGKKMDLLEGGIRVPYVVRWPGRVKPGSWTAQLAITMDWAATFLDAAGVAQHAQYPMDGASLLPVLRDPERPSPRELYWRMLFRRQKALRAGDWKYLVLEGDEFLFNLAEDARERANLSKRDPRRLAAMRERYEAWEKTMPGIPEDAKFAIPYTKADMAQPS
ncbi:MAG: sulfatase [Burkholderiales bacterium]